MMILYHGSNQPIPHPSLGFSRHSLDFGAGFYLTSDLDQAEKWARSVTHIRGIGSPIVSAYATDDVAWSGLSILRFESATSDWLKLVCSFRTNQIVVSYYDVITGPVADDRTVDVIHQYISGTYPEDIAIRLLLPFKLKDQWTMMTQRAIDALLWKEARKV